MQSDFRSSWSGGVQTSGKKEFLSQEEYGLHIDYPPSPSSSKMSAEYDAAESMNIHGMIFKVDPLTRELVLQEQSTAENPSSSLEDVGASPGDILCKLDEIDVHYWSPSSVSSFLAELQSSRKLRRLGLYRKGSGLIMVDMQGNTSSRLHQSPGASTPNLLIGEYESTRRFGLSPHNSAGAADLAGSVDVHYSNEAKSSHSFDPEGRDESRHSSMQANVLKRYKTKIESLTKSLESAHFYMNRQEEKIAELEQQLLQDSSVTRLTHTGQGKVDLAGAVSESWSMELAALGKECDILRAQFASKEAELRQAQTLIETLKHEATTPQENGISIENLKHEIAGLKNELDFLKSNSGTTPLSADNAKIFADLQYDLEVTYAAKNELEAQIAALKRNNLIQAVEIKELQDHINGLEKQNKVGEVLRFPPLPGLESIWESLQEEASNEDDATKRLLAADEELRRAQQEIYVLRKSEHRVQQLETMRQESELMLEAAQREIKALRGAPASMSASKQNSGTEQSRLQTAEQSLLKANMIVSGQSKQLDDLRLENEALQSQKNKLEEEQKRLKSALELLHQISPKSRERAEPHHTREVSGEDKSLMEELEDVQGALAASRAQCSAAEIEIRILNSQLEAITDASMTNERGLLKRIKDLEAAAMINLGRPGVEDIPSDVTALLENQNKIIMKLQEECKLLQLDLSDTKKKQLDAESRLQESLRIVSELREETTGEASQPTLVHSFDSLTEEFQLLKECASISNTKNDQISTSGMNSRSSQELNMQLASMTERVKTLSESLARREAELKSNKAQLEQSAGQLNAMTERVKTLSQSLADQDGELNFCKRQLNQCVEQLKAQMELSKQADEIYKAADSDLMLLLAGSGVETLQQFNQQPDADVLIVKINAVKFLVTALQSDIIEKQVQIESLSAEKDEALIRVRDQGSELATIKVVTTELESEIAHIRCDKEKAYSELNAKELEMQRILVELEARQEQVNVLTTIVGAIRTTSPITWSDIPGHQFQQDYSAERDGALTLGPTRTEAAYHF